MVYFEVLAALGLGIISGIITGLIPGIHVNLVSVLMISFSAVLLDLVSPLILAVYIISLFMVFRGNRKLRSLAAFMISGCLGLIVLTGLPNLKQPLFPLLSGLFGFSILVVSFLQKSKIPPQIEKPLTISNKNMVKSVSAATGVGFMAAFLPGFGSSQAAIVATSLVGDIGD